MYPATGCLFREAAVERLYSLAVPLSVVLLESELRGGLRHFQLLDFTRGRGGVLCIQLSPSVSAPLLLHTSCSQTSGEAVPADTRLQKQWTPVYFHPRLTHSRQNYNMDSRLGILFWYRQKCVHSTISQKSTEGCHQTSCHILDLV